jgi:ATP-dependent 26S proteasome regulatory subunit
MRPRQEIAAGGGTWASNDVHLKTPARTFADVGGLEESKKQIRDLVQANLNGKKFGDYGVFRNGILLHGPRGTGKTFLAEAVAGEFKLKYFSVSAASLLNKFVVRREYSKPSRQSEPTGRTLPDEIDARHEKEPGEDDDSGGAALIQSMTARLMECVDDVRKRPGLTSWPPQILMMVWIRL